MFMAHTAYLSAVICLTLRNSMSIYLLNSQEANGRNIENIPNDINVLIPKFYLTSQNLMTGTVFFLLNSGWSNLNFLMILYNYCILVAFQVPVNHLGKHKYERQISYTDAIDICREYLHPHTNLNNKTLIQLLLRYIHPVRSDRKETRKKRRSRRCIPFTHRIA